MTGFWIVVLLAIAAWLLLKWRETRTQVESLVSRLAQLENEVARLGQRGAIASSKDVAATAAIAGPTQPAPAASVPPPLPPILGPVVTPGVPRPSTPTPAVGSSADAFLRELASPEPRPSREVPKPPLPGSPVAPPKKWEVPAINWENFLGVKLFAWLGGLALFLGVAFFVKYSFEHNLISPQMRVIIGYVTGTALLAGGLMIPRQRHLVTVQTLCATGILVLYAVTFAARAYYHLLSLGVAFGVMTLVTTAAFLIALRLNAQVVAILGLLGGFLTPPLLSTGQDNPLGLFSYIALLDIGLLAVTLRKRWNHLTLLAAMATVVMQTGWVVKFFTEQKFLTGVWIFVGFAALFTIAFAAAHRLKIANRWNAAAAMAMSLAGLLFALYLLWHPYPQIASNVWLLFGFVFVLDTAFPVLAWLRRELRPFLMVSGALVFLLLMSWTSRFLTADLLNPALAFYLLFAIVHAVVPLVMERVRPSGMKLWWVHAYPALALVLILVPLFRIEGPSNWIWPVVLMIDLVAIILAAVTASLISILAVLVLTVIGTAAWIFQLPADLPSASGMLVVIGGFAVFFVVAAILASRKVLGGRAVATANVPTGTAGELSPAMLSQIASMAAMLPFLLLTLVILRLPLADPSPVFGLAALLTVLLLGLVRAFRIDTLAAVALGSVLLVEYAWHFRRFTAEQFGLAFGWYAGFSALFLVFPFLFAARFEKRVIPWAVAALALPLHFFLFYEAFRTKFPAFAYNGLLPAAMALPCLFGLFRLIRSASSDQAHRLTTLALFGGASLFFITLIFPIQFERQWITLGWALEGAALLWLFHRVPHPGLRIVGVGLLLTSFARLALNPWVITAYARTGTPLLNWYLYTYGIAALCCLVGAWLLSPPRNRLAGVNVPPILYALGTILLFLLVNIEIADFFSPRGQERLTFNFSASFAQDTAYSLAWALFAFLLLTIGFRLRNSPTRYAGMGLLVVTLIKLFLHDLWRLGGLHRIGSLIGLAVVLILVSFIYQRFFSAGTGEKKDSATPTPS